MFFLSLRLSPEILSQRADAFIGPYCLLVQVSGSRVCGGGMRHGLHRPWIWESRSFHHQLHGSGAQMLLLSSIFLRYSNTKLFFLIYLQQIFDIHLKSLTPIFYNSSQQLQDALFIHSICPGCSFKCICRNWILRKSVSEIAATSSIFLYSHLEL